MLSRLSLLFVLLVCLSLYAVPVASQTFACGGAGYDLSSIGDLTASIGGYTWTINPCIPLTTGSCAGMNATFCQGGTVVNYYNPLINVVAWSGITNGILSKAVNGEANQCSAQSVRTGSVQYFCNAAATTAYISDVEEPDTCQYVASVQTSLVCGPALTAVAMPVGLPFSTSLCGGGLFDLSSIDKSDYMYTYGGSTYWFRPCSPLTAQNCTAGTSFCQQGNNALSSGSGIPQTYTLQSNGLIIQSQDGTVCGNVANHTYGFPREANVVLVCDPTATNPVIVSSVESTADGNEPTTYEYCHYTVTFRTAAVCNRLTANPTPVLQPQFGCGGAGYDLTLISAVDMVLLSSTTFTWIINPCRPISQGPCAGHGATFCQSGSDEYYYTSGTVAAYYQPIYAPVFWSTAAVNGTTAIQSFSIYGDQGCGVYGTRTARVIYVCDPNQVRPLSQLLSVTEGPTCQYTAIVNTSLVCSTPLAVSSSSSLSFTSNVCGGGVYDLSSLDSSDFAFSNGGSDYWWRPCSLTTTVANCTKANATFCQSNYGNPFNALQTSLSLNPAAVTSYTPQYNGLLIQSQDGTYCGAIPRASTTYLVCNQSATTPQVVSFTENNGIAGYLNDGQAYCHYELILMTNVVCATAAAPGSSSSAGAAAVSSSSGSQSGVVVVGGSSVSSSGSASVVASSSSAVSAVSAVSAISSSSAMSAASAVSAVSAISSSAVSAASAVSSSSVSASASAALSSSVSSSAASTVQSSSSATSPSTTVSSSSSSAVAAASVSSSSSSSSAAAAGGGSVTSSTAAPSVSSASSVVSASSAGSSAATAATSTVVSTPVSSSTAQPGGPTSVNSANSQYTVNVAVLLALAVAALML